jgi:hypothetical protein
MDITIATSEGAEVRVKLKDLTKSERAALAGLLGMRSVKGEVFKLFRELPHFRKLKGPEVFKQCPHNARFKIELVSGPAEPGVEAQALSILNQIDPEARFGIRRYTLGGYCPKCRTRHEVTRVSAMVTLDHAGMTYTRRFEV